VSGLAFGIDICAHEEALRNGIQTIGILGHGLDRIYPSQHKDIARKMMQSGGFYTEFWSGSIAEKVNFIKRNRIIAGISEATVVVESACVGGSLATARFASSYDRDVLAVPGRTNDRYSEGCNKLIKSNRASMLTSVSDLEYVLGWSCEKSVSKPIQKTLPFELDHEEKLVFEQLSGSEEKWLDSIAKECGLGVQKTVSILLQLELKGMVSSHSGKRFRAV
jgi:DNA processing protein